MFIILKEDQATGQETSGVVQDVLTKGNHPRGIKVRLRDGQVGRVQRMGSGDAVAAAASPTTGLGRRYTDVRLEDEYVSELPSRSLADFMPELGEQEQARRSRTVDEAAVVVKCPFCEGFEGDEAAVTHHIDREHLT